MVRSLVLRVCLSLGVASAALGEEPAPPPVEQRPLRDPPSDAVLPTLETFQAALEPFGRWLRTPEQGLAWSPTGAGWGWRPYSNGRWVFTEEGWTFASDEPWAWATFHYGRWVLTPAYGWLWIPGYEWAPAWVTWRYSGGYVAWAPMGPAGLPAAYYEAPGVWVAVGAAVFDQLLSPSFLVPVPRLELALRGTYFAGLPRLGFYLSPPARHFERLLRHSVPRVPMHGAVPHRYEPGRRRPGRGGR